MSSYGCQSCHVPWPYTSAYSACPICGRATDKTSASALSKEEAESRVTHARFEDFYKSWNRKRVLAGIPSPEELGAEEARAFAQTLNQIRKLPERS